MTLRFSKTRNVKSPVRANVNDAGLDFFVPDDMPWESFTMKTNHHILIPSGIKVDVPPGHMFISLEKSGIATKGIIIGARVVDSGYQGEIHIHIMNVGKEDYTVRRGQKIVQFVLIPIVTPKLLEVSDIDFMESTRGSGGFGSTGI